MVKVPIALQAEGHEETGNTMNQTSLQVGACMLGCVLLAPFFAVGAAESAPDNSLDSMSIEELLTIEVSSAARKPQLQFDVPAAVFVITREDIARSSATSIPELLRMAPGVNVAKLDASKWSVTIRGFGGRFADKLLVLVDGRSVYSPIFSGTIWEDLHYPMAMIERIEVIRGPGGTAWGTNAVNGIINIITRSASTLDGGLVSLRAGTEIDADFSALYGGPLGKNRYVRLYLRENRVDGGELVRPGVQQNDRWHATQVGGGMEWELGDDRLSFNLNGVEAQLHDTYELSPFRYPFRRFVTDNSHDQDVSLSGLWERALGEDSELRLQGHIQHYESQTLFAEESRSTGDIDFQHRFRPTPNQEIVWGLGARYTSDDLTPDVLAEFTPRSRRYRTFSGFIQDELSFLDGALRLTVGTKLEHNDFTGIEFQPTLRVAWTPSERTTWWAAITRAVGTPSRAEEDVRIRAFALPGIDVVQVGNTDLDSESVVSIEAGLRRVLSEQLSVSISGFYSDYDDFRTVVLQPPFVQFEHLPRRAVIPFRATNDAGAVTRGVEVVIDWQPHARWHTRLLWSYLDIQITRHTNYLDLITPLAVDDTPTHQIGVQQHITLTERLLLDIDFRFVDALESLDIGAYSTVDVRLGWRPREDLEVAIVGQYLLQPSHTELNSSIGDSLPSKVERGVYGQITWEF